LGTGNEEEKRQKLMMLAQGQGQVLQAAVNAPPQVYAKMYACSRTRQRRLALTYRTSTPFAPDSPEYQQLQQNKPQQQDPKMMQVQANAQAEQARLQQEGHASPGRDADAGAG
jgi:hypothetical protein